ncbi:peptidylprolyl isomerase [Leptolyngbya sp. FACHB-261]|uniref:peptidylprolyl isomerase n=1 Tax=Leptolyngbya sp. FACHB-261 TaxID=2692806 RepID=UPI001684226C|nr:peptidylprolyl isomerase [Leptolyngbya sp. FACHB-261]MBD2102045.1 peptidylprolyl isomerase [Leptolyngbya sp. FACHB-261]
MTTALQIGKRVITAEEIIPLLTSYQMLPQLVRESLIDQAIADIACTEEETTSACEQFYERRQLTSEAARQAWLQCHDLTLEQLQALATRDLRIEKFKQATWGHKLQSYFLNRKEQLDKVIYSLIRTHDMGIAQELYFRIGEGEQTFSELTREYAQGPEAQTDGLVGPVELGKLHPTLARILSLSQPGHLWMPIHLGEWFVVVRLEKWLSAQFDEAMRCRLLNELFENWLQKQMQQQFVEQQSHSTSNAFL